MSHNSHLPVGILGDLDHFIFLSVSLDVTIGGSQGCTTIDHIGSFSISRVGFRKPRGIPIYLLVHGSDGRIQILSDAILLEGYQEGLPTFPTR